MKFDREQRIENLKFLAGISNDSSERTRLLNEVLRLRHEQLSEDYHRLEGA